MKNKVESEDSAFFLCSDYDILFLDNCSFLINVG